MRFDRGLRSVMMKPYPVGHTAIPTDDVNSEDPSCQFGGIKDRGSWLGDDILPTIIELCVRLIPVWIDDEVATAQLDHYTPCALYPSKSAYSKVRVEAVGFRQYQRSSGEEKIPFVGTQIIDCHLDLPKPYLYEKQFLLQADGRRIHWHSRRMISLGAYGAQQVGEDIHPFVFTLDTLRDETRLNLTSLLYWRERGIFPDREGGIESEGVVFIDPFEEDQARTFLESIAAGMAVINLEIGEDETGSIVKVPYHSCQLSNNHITYKREEYRK